MLAALSRSRSLDKQGSALAAGAASARHLGRVHSAADRLQCSGGQCRLDQAGPDSCALPRRAPKVKLQPLQLPACTAASRPAAERQSSSGLSSASASSQLMQLEMRRESSSTASGGSGRHCSSPSSCCGSGSGASRLPSSCQQGGAVDSQRQQEQHDQQQQALLPAGCSISGFWPLSAAAGGLEATHAGGGGGSSSARVLRSSDSRSRGCVAPQQGAPCLTACSAPQQLPGVACAGGGDEGSAAQRMCSQCGSGRWSPSASPAAGAISHSSSRGRQKGAHVH